MALSISASPDGLNPSHPLLVSLIASVQAISADTPILLFCFSQREDVPNVYEFFCVANDGRVWLVVMTYNPDHDTTDADPAVSIDGPGPWRDHTLALLRAARSLCTRARNELKLSHFRMTWGDVPSTISVRSELVRVGGGKPIGVSFSTPTPHRLDWVGLFRVGDPDSAYLAWQYTNGPLVGDLVFTAPEAPGSYEFRFFQNNGGLSSATSAPFTV